MTASEPRIDLAGPAPLSGERPAIEVRRSCGMTISTEIPLPEMAPAGGPEDVTIRYGDFPHGLVRPALVGPRFQIAPGQYQLEVAGVARYQVTSGNTVLVDPEPRASPEDVRSFILSSVTGVLVHQRGLLPLHANAISNGVACMLFAGSSGSGKSTLTAAFNRRGWHVFAEDISAVEAGNAGAPHVHRGHHHMKLWKDVVEHLRIPVGGVGRVRADLDKFSVSPDGQPRSGPLPVRIIFVLRPGNPDDTVIEPLRGREKHAVLDRETYRRRLVDGLGGRREHFHATAALATHVDVVSVRYRKGLTRLEALTDRLGSYARALGLAAA